ncbi:hypothetical protein B0189_10085, partial [Moraxella cuniculi]
EATIKDTSTAPVEPVNLTIALADDTFGAGTRGTNSDNISKNGQVNVTGVPAGQAWQYTTDGGKTWTDGTTSSTGENSFTMPNNNELRGVSHKLQVRLKDTPDTKSNELTATYDKVTTAGRVTAKIEGQTATLLVTDLEPGAVASVNGQNRPVGNDGVVLISGLQISGPTSIFGTGGNATSQNVNIGYNLTDIAGNTAGSSTSSVYKFINMPRVYSENAPNEKTRVTHITNNVGDSNDIILVGVQGNAPSDGDIVARAGTPVNIDTRGGDDTIIAKTIQSIGIGNTTINMGAGNDSIYLSAYISASGTGDININMGDGNDLIKTGFSTNQALFSSTGASPVTIDMGRGDDTFVLVGRKNGAGPVNLKGGEGFDTLEIEGATSQYNSGKVQFNDNNFNITGFERILFKNGTSIDLSVQDIANNGNGTKVINGVSYTGLFIETTGAGAAKVNLGTDNGNGTTPGFTKQADAPEGYNAYLADSGQMVYIQDVITIL